MQNSNVLPMALKYYTRHFSPFSIHSQTDPPNCVSRPVLLKEIQFVVTNGVPDTNPLCAESLSLVIIAITLPGTGEV